MTGKIHITSFPFQTISDEYVVSILPNKLETIGAMGLLHDFLYDGDGGFLGDFDRVFLNSPMDQAAIIKYDMYNAL